MSKLADVDMKGKTVVVTGSTGGIGKEIARALARMGATVVLGARDRAKAEATKSELAAETKNEHLHALVVDVSSLASIRSFAAEVKKTVGKVHVLVNNAGAWFTDRRTSPDGHELTFATNVLGPYALTSLLEDSFAPKARVVNVVSAFASDYDESDLQYETRKFDGFKAYGQSKQALRMLTWGAAKRLAGKGVTVNAAAPGFVKTNFNQNAKGFMATMIGMSAWLFAVSPAKGAETPIWAAIAPELEGVTAKYFDGMKEKDGKFREEGPIATLEQACEKMLRASGAARPAAAASA